MTIRFKACPKCRGDLYLGEDIFGKYISCLQCGYLKDASAEEELAGIAKPAPKEDKKAA